MKPTGDYSVEVYDENLGLISMANGFSVLANSTPPTLVTTSPESGAINQVLPITISLENTHFAQATDNTISLSQGTTTILPIPGTVVALNDNYIKALFDLNNPNIWIGDVLNSHCGNSFDGYFTDSLSVNITDTTFISGAITYTGSYIGIAELYQKNVGVSPSTYSLVEAVSITGANEFSFANVAEATYLIRSVPIGMTDVVATYYPNNIDWNDATEITTVPVINNSPYDITPFYSINLNGGATVNGAIGYGPNGFKASIVMAEGIEVFLKNTTDNIFAQAVTDENGAYMFNNVPNGNYQIVVNIPGYAQISSYDFVVNAQDIEFSDLDFLIDNHEIFKSGFMGIVSIDLTELTTYPNPTNGELFIQIPESMSDFNVVIHNQVGQRVWERMVTNNSTKNYFADISSLMDGIYFVIVQNDKSTYQIKVVKAE
ncbi:MAG: T9SS type A sorting domain-containing protein [Crocinitomicaceae bacterium]|nr:T9SS type A sorting domain-containing protein [Crocinitomicaceae bacterium]